MRLKVTFVTKLDDKKVSYLKKYYSEDSMFSRNIVDSVKYDSERTKLLVELSRNLAHMIIDNEDSQSLLVEDDDKNVIFLEDFLSQLN